MGVPFDINISPTFQRQGSQPFFNSTLEHIPAQCLGNLKIDQMRDVNDLGFVAQAEG